MVSEIKNMPVNRSLIALSGTILLPIITIFIITTIYAFKLAFEVQGPPDEQLISEFAESIAIWLSPVLKVLFTFLSVKWIKNKVSQISWFGGVFFAICVIFIGLILDVIFGDTFHTIQLLWMGLILAAGALAGGSGKNE